MMRRWLALGLATWLTALTGCAALPQKSPDQIAATLPPDLVAVKRKDLANSLMTGFLAYQFLKPYAEQACQPLTPGGPLPSQECYELSSLDGQLKTVWDQFWNGIFEWAPGAGTPQTDWSKILDVLINLLLKVAGKVVLGMRPLGGPRGPMQIPQLAPRSALDTVAPVVYAVPTPSAPAEPQDADVGEGVTIERLRAILAGQIGPIGGLDDIPPLMLRRGFAGAVGSDR